MFRQIVPTKRSWVWNRYYSRRKTFWILETLPSEILTRESKDIWITIQCVSSSLLSWERLCFFSVLLNSCVDKATGRRECQRESWRVRLVWTTKKCPATDDIPFRSVNREQIWTNHRCAYRYKKVPMDRTLGFEMFKKISELFHFIFDHFWHVGSNAEKKRPACKNTVKNLSNLLNTFIELTTSNCSQNLAGLISAVLKKNCSNSLNLVSKVDSYIEMTLIFLTFYFGFVPELQ